MNLAKHCIDQQVAALQNLYSVIESDDYKKILSFLEAVIKYDGDYARRIIMAGVGKNSNIATKISETMASLGIPSFYLNITHCGHGDFGFIGPNDVIIHISRSGQTQEMLEVINYVKLIRPSVSQILIHCKKDKAPSKADFELFIGGVIEGDKEGLAPTTSTTALLCILDTIAVTLSDSIGFTRQDFLKYHPAGALGAMLKAEQNA
jgi:D-arabinose 5-phosphate isomerase GutQ